MRILFSLFVTEDVFVEAEEKRLWNEGAVVSVTLLRW